MRPAILRLNGARGYQLRASLANSRNLPVDHSKSGRSTGEREKPAKNPPNTPSAPPGEQNRQTRRQAPGRRQKERGGGRGQFPGGASARMIPKGLWSPQRRRLPYKSTKPWKYSGSRFKQAVCQLVGRRGELRRPVSDLVLGLRTIRHRHLVPDDCASFTA